MNEPMIEVKDLSYTYRGQDEKTALSLVSFSVPRGEWLAVIGRNGAGKSTLADLLIGLLKPQAGSIRINGQLLDESSKWAVRRHMGIVFQNPDNQFIGTTVEDDVAFGLENSNMPVDKMKVRVAAALDMVGLSDVRQSDPSRLSGGQKQRVAIAGILALQPDILILDEAFVMLDPKSRRDLLKTLRQLAAETHLTILSITHDMDEAAASDRILVMQDGKIVNDGTPGQIFSTELTLGAPFSERLRRLLLKEGRRAPANYMTENEMVGWLWK